jgi:hypothetical protein
MEDRLGTTWILDGNGSFPTSAAGGTLFIAHAIESADDEIVIVRMNGVAAFDRLITVEQFVEETLSTIGEHLVRQDFEMPEGPEQNDAFGEC